MITYNGSIIVDVSVDIFLSSISGPSSLISQTFTVRFLALGQPSNVASRSGNPGYLNGLPILVARVPERSDMRDIKVTTLTLPTFDSSGVCRTDVTQNVLFGESVQMSCIVYLNITNAASGCVGLQGDMLQLLASSNILPNYVAQYGNGTTFDPKQFVAVLREVTNEPSFVSDINTSV